MKREDVKREGVQRESRIGVCMIISCFYPVMGGAERQAQQLGARLIERGIEVCILTRRYKGLKSYEEVDGIPVYRIWTLNKGRILASLSYTFFSLLWLCRNRNKYPILHCHQPVSPATIGVLGKILWRKKVIVKITTSGERGNIREIKRLPFHRLRRSLLSLADVFIALSDESREELRDFGLDSVEVREISNGVDTERFHPVLTETRHRLRGQLSLPETDKLVIYTGRLEPKKVLDTLLYAWQLVLSGSTEASTVSSAEPLAEVSAEVPVLSSAEVEVLHAGETNEAQLVILGEGSEKASLVSLANKLGMEGGVWFLGRKDNVVEYLQGADIFVMPSVSEGMSNALLEAMACGLAVVATDIAGNNEVIRHGDNGLLVKPKDPQQLSEALHRLLNDASLAKHLGQEARRTVEERYSMAQVTDQYMKLYQSLASDIGSYIASFRRTKDKKYLRLFYGHEEYMRTYAGKPHPKWLKKFRIMSQLMGLQPGEKVLDVGCASQMFRPYVEQAGAIYKGLDISEGFEPDYVCDAEDVSIIGSDEFDWVILSDILEHLPEPIKAIRESHRVGRKVIAVVPNWYELNRLSFLPRHPKERHVIYLGPRGWIKLFEKAGFEIQHVHGFCYVPSIAFYPPLRVIDRLLRASPFLIRLSDFIDSTLADKPLFRFCGQELIVVGGRRDAPAN